MNLESKGMKVLYAIFLTVVTIRGIVSLYDRFYQNPEKKQINE